jgi:hypothetical protein
LKRISGQSLIGRRRRGGGGRRRRKRRGGRKILNVATISVHVETCDLLLKYVLLC